MKKSGSQQLLAKQRLPRASVRLHGLGECLLLLGSGFLTAGAQIGGLALPLGACLTASLPFGRRSLSAALGAAAGYALLCEPAMAAERIALTALLLAAIVVFQGTTLPATRWFLPAMAAGTALVLGSLQVFGGNGGWRPALQWLTVSAAAGVGTAVLRCGTGAGERGRPLYFAALLSGLSGLTALGLPVDPGLIGGCAMVYGAPELSAVCAAAAALGLTGNLGWSVTAALLLPAVTARVVRSDLARALLGGALCCGVLWLGGVGTPAAFAAVGVGIPLGLWLRRTGALRASGPAAAEELAARRMGDAAQVLELLQAQLPVQERGLSEADSVYDGAAERICRCCARFHRCWQHNARQTYDALEQAAGRLLQRGKAEAADFPAEFREGCCHFDGFLAALDQELESMLYRRRYRVQLQESRALLSEEFGCVAEYLRRMQAELGAPQPDAPRYRAVTGICTAGRHGAAANGDRGACFPGPRNDYYVLLCDGIGHGGACRRTERGLRASDRRPAARRRRAARCAAHPERDLPAARGRLLFHRGPAAHRSDQRGGGAAEVGRSAVVPALRGYGQKTGDSLASAGRGGGRRSRAGAVPAVPSGRRDARSGQRRRGRCRERRGGLCGRFAAGACCAAHRRPSGRG